LPSNHAVTSARRRSAGLTMIELVVVIVILGIVATVAAPRIFDDRTFLERGYFEELAAALKYAQKLAVASGCPVRMIVDASGYSARQQAAQGGRCDPNGAWTTDVQLSDGERFSGASPPGVAASPPVTMIFDALGRTDLGSDRNISVGSFQLIVRADSGFVQAL
jgi:MSHA pilin protein MshC